MAKKNNLPHPSDRIETNLAMAIQKSQEYWFNVGRAHGLTEVECFLREVSCAGTKKAVRSAIKRIRRLKPKEGLTP